ncbi:AraC family transcriptional regulator [Anaerobacillus alkaliphilus]|uniref:AraC family transcriptional regulator n=1 Tax=Anaerobacillus alkaliphilus TaxID=1548597 RepID=A0A4Q0VUN2_9BACI|nr:helix-turn-helix domain-containing protein [Anaerobacillus alkaliphilus]RXJ02446.1 AraC family transcriptional regulator [Anaerobacillus alkaliphilus]
MVKRDEDFEINSFNHSRFSNNLTYISNGHKPPNMHKWGPGVRDIYALHYIERGKGVLETRHGRFSLKAGESFMIYPHMEIHYYPDLEDPWEYVWVDFNGEEAEKLLSLTMFSPDKPVVPICNVNLKSFFDIGVNINTKPFDKLRSDAKLRLLLSYYIEYYQKETLILQTDYVGVAKNYIHNNYWKNTMRVSDIVNAAKIERSYLFRLFKEETGMSISTYVTEYRIRRACELLKSAELSIKSVAYSVGYRDQLYFSKIFKKATSHTPSEYMTLHANRSVL